LTFFDRFLRRPVSLEAQLDNLVACGIRPRGGVTVEDLLAGFNREKYEKNPYLLLLCVLGSESERAPHGFLSNDIWHLDTECIEDHGSYAQIAYRMTDLAAGVLPISDVQDYVDLEEEKASLSFLLNGEQVTWSARVQDDWIDPAILTKFVRLLDDRKTGRHFTYLDLKGQDCIIGCSAEVQLTDLRKKTGLHFDWLR
jgi:hypothetical protein